jgi:hypothetical protein
LVLIDGDCDDNAELAQSYGFKNVITLLELMALFPEISPSTTDLNINIVETKARLLKRHNLSEEEFKSKLCINAIFLLCFTSNVWHALQIFCDLISTKDGKILGDKREPSNKQFV